MSSFFFSLSLSQTDECFIQFIETNNYITLGTALAAFYVPVTIMCVLYWRVWRETEKRQKGLSNLQAGKKNDSHRSNSRYYTICICCIAYHNKMYFFIVM